MSKIKYSSNPDLFPTKIYFYCIDYDGDKLDGIIDSFDVIQNDKDLEI
jgi:hypothetical protein